MRHNQFSRSPRLWRGSGLAFRWVEYVIKEALMIHNFNIKQTLRILLVAITISFFGCCPTTSLYPLSDANDLKYDEKLMGAWKADIDNSLVYLHIGKGKDNFTQIQIIEHKNNGTLDNSTLVTFPSFIDGDRFLNVQMAMLQDGKYEGYFFVMYKFLDHNHLSLINWDERVLEKAIEDGRLKGEINHQQDQGTKRTYKCYRITDKTENIIQFIKTYGKETIFIHSIGTFERIDSKGITHP
jgi:hypothetical protein